MGAEGIREGAVAGLTAQGVVDPPVVGDVVAVGVRGAGRQEGRQVAVGDAELDEVRHERSGVLEGEGPVELQSVDGDRDASPRRLPGLELLAHGAGAPPWRARPAPTAMTAGPATSARDRRRGAVADLVMVLQEGDEGGGRQMRARLPAGVPSPVSGRLAITSLGPCTSSGWNRDAGSGTRTSPPSWSTRKRYRVPGGAPMATTVAQPCASRVIGQSGPDSSSWTLTSRAVGAHSAKRVRPAPSHSAPNGIRCDRLTPRPARAGRAAGPASVPAAGSGRRP